MDIRSRDTFSRTPIQASAGAPVDVSQMHTTLLPPSTNAGQALPKTLQNIAWHRTEAALWREQADQLIEPLRQEMNRFAQGVARWQRLVRLSTRTPEEEAELAALELDIQPRAESMARSRKRWIACIVAAREHEDDAQRLRALLLG
jgi:hypothetical protein